MSYPELAEEPFKKILNQIAGNSPTPGGGAAAAAAAALAAATLQMVAETTLKRRRYEAGWPAASAARDRLPEIRDKLELAMSEDVVAYRQVVLVLSYQTEDNSATTIQALEDALTGAAQVPLKVAQLAKELVQHGRRLVKMGNAHAAADAAAACHLAAAAARTSITNVHINLRDVSNEKLKKSWINQAGRVQRSIDDLTADLHEQVVERLDALQKQPRGRRRR